MEELIDETFKLKLKIDSATKFIKFEFCISTIR